MPILFRTAYPPISYKTPLFSCGSFTKLLCMAVKYLVPIIICVFYFFHQSQLTTDMETPILSPNSIEYFSLILQDSAAALSVFTYPSTSANGPQVTISTVRNTNSTGFLTSVNYRISIPDLTFTDSTGTTTTSYQVVGLNCIFSFNVVLRGWVNSSTNSYGMYIETFKNPLSTHKVEGDLALFQTAPIDFRSNLPNDVIPTMQTVNIKNLIEAQKSVSSRYYVNWNSYSGSISTGTASSFQSDIIVNVRDIEIVHTLPLVSIIESIVILYLSTYILCSLIVNAIQHFLFYNGIIKTFRDQYFTPMNNKAIPR